MIKIVTTGQDGRNPCIPGMENDPAGVVKNV
jgi:hypothetical protein